MDALERWAAIMALPEYDHETHAIFRLRKLQLIQHLARACENRPPREGRAAEPANVPRWSHGDRPA